MSSQKQEKLILLVGGTAFNQENIKELLEIYNYSVLISDTPEEALEQMRIFQPNLVLFDTYQPSTVGREFLELKYLDLTIKDIPLIILTSSSRRIDLIVAIDLGAKDCLVHPFRIDNLMQVIQRYLY